MDKTNTQNEDKLGANSVVSSSNPSKSTNVSIYASFTKKGKHNITKKSKLKNYMRNTIVSMKKQNVKYQNNSLANFCTSLKYPNVKTDTPLKQILQTNKPALKNSHPNLRMFNDWDGKRDYDDSLNHFNDDDPSFGVDPYNHFN